MDLEEKELIGLLREAGSREEGFRKLLVKYQEEVYWLIRRIVINHDDADDLTQETFIKIWQHIEGFRAESSLFTWIYRIATNEALGHLKKKRIRNFVSLTPIEKYLSNSIQNDAFFRGDEAHLRFQQAILKLPEKQRIVFNIKYFNEITYEEMAEILQTSEGALKASYHHAVKKIEKFLTGQ